MTSVEFTNQEKQALVQLIMNCRFTPDEWESVFKPIVVKLNTGDVNANKV